MSVYFVYRCNFGLPTEKFVRRFEYDTVLDWAKATWILYDSDADAEKHVREVFGDIYVGALRALFHKDVLCSCSPYSVRAWNPHRPRTMADVKAWLTAFYCEGEAHGRYHIQARTEWGEQEQSIHVFDDRYRTQKPGKTDFLLLEEWELPEGESDGPVPKLPRTTSVKPQGDGEGVVYFASTSCDCKYNLEDLCPATHIRGLRLPDLARYLLLRPDPYELEFPLSTVRINLDAVLADPKGEDAGFLIAIRDHPEDRTNWGVYSDWLADRDLPPAGLYLLDRALRAEVGPVGAEMNLVRVTRHAAQAHVHERRDGDSRRKEITPNDQFATHYFFDDRWAAAHPTLATGILTFASRWDVLTDGPRLED